MKSQNFCVLIGNVGKTPELISLSNSDKQCFKFSVATNKAFKKDDEFKSNTSWHNIECWSEYVIKRNENLQSGDPVYIMGEINYQEWEADGGVKRSKTVIKATEIIKLAKGEKVEKENAFDKHDKEQGLESTKVPEYDVDSDSEPF